MRWRPTELEDFQRLEPLQPEQLAQDLRDQLVDTPAARDTYRAWARTLEHEGKVLAIVGVQPLWKGVGEAWGMLSSAALRHPVALTRGTRYWLQWIVEHQGLWRVQMTVEHGHDAARRWATHLGFTYEGTLEWYGPNRAHHDLYARLTPWQP